MVKNIGDMNRSELIDYIIELDEENRQLCKKLSFKEKCRRKEERSLMKKIDNLSKGNKWLLNETEFQQNRACEYKLRVDKVIEFIESYNIDFKNCRFGEASISIRELGYLLDILKGVDK